MSTFAALMKPLEIKGVRLPNRIVFPPTVTNYADAEGKVTERLIRYYREIARHGVGLTVVGATAIARAGNLFPLCSRIDGDEYLEGLSRLFSAIREAGSVPAVQLAHAGRQTSQKMTGEQPVAPSPIPCPVWKDLPRELSAPEIEKVEDDFAEGTRKAKLAGAAMVELHGAHGYLINQFLSPNSNHRTDHYGGSLENRARFARNILHKTRARVGSDYPIICRISAEEFMEGGLTLSETREIAALLVENGVDIISVSAGVAASRPLRDQYMKQGRFWELAGEIKQAIPRTPVIAVGKILDLATAEKVMESQGVELIAICRALIADPEMVTKSLEGKADEIIRCIECGNCTASLVKDDLTMQCSVNAGL
ncbi:MAG: NADH:flavin oxidoreductase [Candidatus Tectomicrobia bacterium]|uniref:NADH:flavin oxidoreductase n=1 Tax=Tectimicrobiota bacterium TaxID=2528274 RepID=A0A932FWZ6_UNCTE|nr:NADH:flavin oxidoreductase [Candidatus Tectomicrobia bacterium]